MLDQRLRQSGDHLAGLERELSTLEENLGSAVHELLERLDRVMQQLEEQNRKGKTLDDQQKVAIEVRGKGLGSFELARGKLEECEEERRLAIGRLGEVVSEQLLAGLGSHWRSPLEGPLQGVGGGRPRRT